MLVLVLHSGSSSIECWLLEVLEKRGMGSSSDMVTIGRRPATGSEASRPRNERRRSWLVPQGCGRRWPSPEVEHRASKEKS